MALPTRGQPAAVSKVCGAPIQDSGWMRCSIGREYIGQSILQTRLLCFGSRSSNWSGWQQPALLGEQVGKHCVGGLPRDEAFMNIEQQLLNQRLRLLTTRFPDGFDRDAPLYR